MGLSESKPVFGGLRTTQVQTSLLILISAFVIRLLESIISIFDTSEISIIYLLSLDEETGLRLALSETPKTGFVKLWPIWFQHNKGLHG